MMHRSTPEQVDRNRATCRDEGSQYDFPDQLVAAILATNPASGRRAVSHTGTLTMYRFWSHVILPRQLYSAAHRCRQRPRVFTTV